MAIYFSEKFKSLRKKSDLMQDQIADLFHVSPQSVSRWETGANYPDIELLPHIAAFFNVTVDELLGTETIRSAQKTYEYKRDIRNLLNVGKVDDAIALGRKAAKEFPVHYDLQSVFLQALCTSGAEECKDESIATGERILRYCTDQDISLWVKYQLINQYVKWGMKAEARKIVDSLPTEAYFTKELNLGKVLEGDAWLHNQKMRIVRFSIMLCDLIGAYAHKADVDALQKIEWLKAVQEIEALASAIDDDPSDDQQITRAFRYITIATYYCEADDAENALRYIEEATQASMHHLDKMDQTNEDGTNHFPWPTPRNLCWILWEDHLAKPQFDIVRSSERFAKCFALLQGNSREIEG